MNDQIDAVRVDAIRRVRRRTLLVGWRDATVGESLVRAATLHTGWASDRRLAQPAPACRYRHWARNAGTHARPGNRQNRQGDTRRPTAPGGSALESDQVRRAERAGHQVSPMERTALTNSQLGLGNTAGKEHRMASEWDAIVVGGGIVGLSTAYALARNGTARVLLLERHVIGSGTTTWGTGAVQVHRFSRVDTEVVNRSRLLMEELSDLVGPAFTYYQVGRVTLAPEADAAVLEESVHLAKDCGIGRFHTYQQSARGRDPGINTDDLGLATLSTVDGRVFSNTLACALAGAARDAGVVDMGRRRGRPSRHLRRWGYPGSHGRA